MSVGIDQYPAGPGGPWIQSLFVCRERLRHVSSASIIQHVSAAAAPVALMEETEAENVKGE